MHHHLQWVVKRGYLLHQILTQKNLQISWGMNNPWSLIHSMLILNLHNVHLIRISMMSLGCVCNAVYQKHIQAQEEWYARFAVTGHYQTMTRRRKALLSKIKRRAKEWEDNPLMLLGKVKPRCSLGKLSIRMFQNFPSPFTTLYHPNPISVT